MENEYLLNNDLSVPNEVVLRTTKDDRREVKKKKNANDIIYLGTKQNFIKNVSSFIDQPIIDQLYDKFEQGKKNGAMQMRSGILVKHNIKLDIFKNYIPLISSYLSEFKTLYRNPNFNSDEVLKNLNKYLEKSNYIEFYSDLVFISDAQPKPYFKWFRDIDEIKNDDFEFIKQFLIPKITYWNFKINSFQNDSLEVTWKITYSKLDEINKDSELKKRYKTTEEFLIEEVLSKVSDFSENDIETIKEAIIKVRIGQSGFRNRLLKTHKKCLFTDVSKEELLLAGHIKPWYESSNLERIDANNGILLTPTFDKLFDKFLISFDENGSVIYSTNITEEVWESLFPKLQEIKDKDIKIIIGNHNKKYFDFHRNKFNEIQK